jgi:hypothetical protein
MSESIAAAFESLSSEYYLKRDEKIYTFVSVYRK